MDSEVTLSTVVDPSLQDLVPTDTGGDVEAPDLDPSDAVRKASLEALLLLSRSEHGEAVLTDRNIFPLMEAHYEAELEEVRRCAVTTC